MSKYVDEQYRIWKNLDIQNVRDFLLTEGYFQGFGLLPGIVKPKGLGSISLAPISYARNDMPARTDPIQIITPKADKKKRVFSLIHPYSYIHLVNEITSGGTWAAVQEKLSTPTAVLVYNLPLFGSEILDGEKGWIYFSKIDLVDFSLDYPVCVELDIQNFYGSIYTHSIAWVFLGKERARERLNDYTEFGNRLDKLFQNANDGKTNGIPIGNEVSNIIAEVILKDVDQKISEAVAGLKLDVKILRYRDDYKILCKDQKAARLLVELVSETLYEQYGLVMNDAKTKIHQSPDSAVFQCQHIARSLLNGHFGGSDTYDWTGENLYNFLSDMVNIHSYISEKKYLDNRISDLVRKIREKKLTISSVGKWASPIFSLILSSINDHSIQNTQGFALLEKLIFILNTEDVELSKKMTDKVVSFYKDTKYNYTDLWIFMICKAYNEEYSDQFLQNNQSVLLEMIKSEVRPCHTLFNSRDILNSADIAELNKFELIDFGELAKHELSLLELIDDNDFDNWSVDWYMSR